MGPSESTAGAGRLRSVLRLACALTLFLFAVPSAARAAAKCVPLDEKVLAKRDEAIRAATEAALKKKGWTRVTLEMKGRSPAGSPFQPVPPEAEKDPLAVGFLTEQQAAKDLFVRDAKGVAFPVMVALAMKPTSTVTFCGCAPPAGTGAAPMAFVYRVKDGQGVRRVDRGRVAGLDVKVATVEVRYSEQGCPEPP